MEALTMLAQMSSEPIVSDLEGLVVPLFGFFIVAGSFVAAARGRMAQAIGGFIIGSIFLGFLIVPAAVQAFGRWAGNRSSEIVGTVWTVL